MFREHSCRLRRRTSTLTIRLTRDVLQVWIILVTGYNFILFSRSLNFTRSEAGWCRTSQKLSSVNLCLQSGPSQCCKLSSCYRDTRDIFLFRSLSCSLHPSAIAPCPGVSAVCPDRGAVLGWVLAQQRGHVRPSDAGWAAGRLHTDLI